MKIEALLCLYFKLKFKENTLSKIFYLINEEDGRSDNTCLYKKEKEINRKLQFRCAVTVIERKFLLGGLWGK